MFDQSEAIAYPFPMHLSRGFTYHLSILQYLAALACRTPVHLISLDTELEIKGILRGQLGIEKPEHLNVHTIVNRRLGIRSNTLWFRFGLEICLRKIFPKYQITYLYTRNVKLMAYLVKTRSLRSGYGVRYIFESHQLFSQNLAMEGEFKRGLAEYRLEKIIYPGCDVVFCNTKPLARMIERLFQVRPHVLPVATSESAILPVSRWGDSLARRPYDFVYAGTYSKWKGVDTFLEALGLLVDGGWTGKALLIGVRVNDRPDLVGLIDRFGLDENVVIVPRMDLKNVRELLDQAKIGVVPNSLLADSFVNTSPLKLFDYAARGLHVVCARIPALDGVIEGTDVSWFRPDCAESFASALSYSLETADEVSSNMLEWAVTNTWSQRAETFLNRLHLRVLGSTTEIESSSRATGEDKKVP